MPTLKRPSGFWCVLGGIGVLAGLLAGCDQKQAGPPQAAVPVVTVAAPVAQEITDYDEYTGRVQAVQSVEIRPRVGGFIDSIEFTDGQVVKAGQVLFRIDQRPFQIALQEAEASAVRAQAQLRIAELELERQVEMRKMNATSQLELDQAQGKKDSSVGAVAEAKAAVDKAKLDLDYSVINAPIEGKVSRPLITVGNLVNPGSGGNNVLTTIVSVNPMYVYFDIDERSFLKYQQMGRQRGGNPDNIRNAKVPILVGFSGEAEAKRPGMLDFADNQVNAGTGTISVRGVLDNADRFLTPGLFATVHVQISDPHPVLLVPDRAIGSDQGSKYVLKVNAENVVESQRVELGAKVGELRVVSGVKADDRIIVNGMLRARPGAKVDAKQASAAKTAATTTSAGTDATK